jgi:ATP-dependent RNA helicase DeaD
VSWGAQQGADARRLLAMVCRRGEIQGADVGNIRIARGFSVVEIATRSAEAFGKATQEPDPRNPRVFIRKDVDVTRVHSTARPLAGGPAPTVVAPSKHDPSKRKGHRLRAEVAPTGVASRTW